MPAHLPATVSDCLATGADPNARNGRGETPLHEAAFGPDYPAVVAALLTLTGGADPNAQSGASVRFGETPLELATATGNTAAAEALRVAAAPATQTPQGRCLNPDDVSDSESIDFPWCPASVGFQV